MQYSSPGSLQVTKTTTWGVKYRAALDEWLASLDGVSRGEVDFLLPFVTPQGDVIHKPCDLFASIRRLHYVLGRFGVEDPAAYSSHSCKTTILSWANQLLIPEFERLKQGPTCQLHV